MPKFRVTFSLYHDVEAKTKEEALKKARKIADTHRGFLVPSLPVGTLGVEEVVSHVVLRGVLGHTPAHTDARLFPLEDAG